MPTTVISSDWPKEVRDGIRLLSTPMVGFKGARERMMAWQTVDAALEQRGINWLISAAGGFQVLTPAGVAVVAVEGFTGIFSRFANALMRNLAFEEAGAVELAIALIQAMGGHIPTMFRGAVTKTIKEMLTDRTQLDIAKKAVERSLSGKGWERAAASYQAHIVDVATSQAILHPGLRQTYLAGQSSLRKAEILLEEALELQGQSASLDKSIPKLEKAVRMMREEQHELARGNLRKTWQQSKEQLIEAAYGRISRKPNAVRGTKRQGGVAHQLQNVRFRAVVECRRTAKKAIGITRRGVRLAGKLSAGHMPSVADVIFGYQAAVWLLETAQNPTRQRVAYTERERGANTIELKSVGTDPKPLGQPAGERRKYGYVGKGEERRFEQILGGVEDLDSGKDGTPNSISDPIATEARRRLDNNLGDYK